MELQIENIRVPGKRILCAYPPEPENKSHGGIIIPGAKEKPFHMEVVAIGSIEEEIKAGDTVVFDQFSGSTTVIAGKEYLSLKEEDILCVIEQE